jgi:phosphosulfolactate synthase (CoM biosynthesis protein A)
VNRENTARQSANDRAFPFLRINERSPKPRTRGVTEIRGPYYTPLGPRQLEDILETMGAYIDASAVSELEAEGTRDPKRAIAQAKRFLDAGAYVIMIESEGITENVKTWRIDVVATIIDALPLDRLMFEAADPEVFAWYVKNYGPEVNLFVDHSQIVQLESLRLGIWGTKSLWGRVVTYKG